MFNGNPSENNQQRSIDERVEFLLENLAPEKTIEFSDELDGQLARLKTGESPEIPDSFWDKWYRTAEFETDKQRIRNIKDAEKTIENKDDSELDWHETCLKQAASNRDYGGPWFLV
jgi:hypothetical protein